ncbi:TRAP transporter small permease subunit [Azoarcus taiwanensis]|uniref:TRAP transporter small permease protein n=1 Tax=Azoarcus taiwanensis TaxID=666964 RepID=A0A972J7H0_9RHOO|nr:TRAP transporter small permease subunit [Azoarcus taiwanensis]
MATWWSNSTHSERAVASATERDEETGRPSRPGLWHRFESGLLLSGATVLFLSATVIMLYEAVGRAFLNTSYFWAEEAVRYLMVWAFFLTVGAAGTAGHHIRTDLLVERLGRRAQQVCHFLASLTGLGFSGVLFYASLPQVQRYYTMGMMTESNLDLPLWALFLAMPIGAVLFFAYYLSCLLRTLKGENPFAASGPTGSEL